MFCRLFFVNTHKCYLYRRTHINIYIPSPETSNRKIHWAHFISTTFFVCLFLFWNISNQLKMSALFYADAKKWRLFLNTSAWYQNKPGKTRGVHYNKVPVIMNWDHWRLTLYCLCFAGAGWSVCFLINCVWVYFKPLAYCKAGDAHDTTVNINRTRAHLGAKKMIYRRRCYSAWLPCVIQASV